MVELEPCCSSCTLVIDRKVVGAVHGNGQPPGSRKRTLRGTVSESSATAHYQMSLGKNSFSPTTLTFLLLVTSIALFMQNDGVMAQNTGKCYSFSPGLTIPGAEFRRDYGLSRRDCADVCKSDLCCMAFEWRRNGGQCTLKSRSLNGTVTAASKLEEKHERQKETSAESEQDKDNNNNSGGDAIFFALCLDYGDSDRDRFWDHELSGPVVASAGAIERGKCAELCGDFAMPVAGGAKRYRRTERAEPTPPEGRSSSGSAVIYSWRTQDPADMEAPLGECQCISVLQHIRISFGSFAGFLM
uniref:Apple domain-containing protein n=1 Tax=Globodera rostochiensis TaxID=31243 RepID=A0A914HC93_GLORO